MRCSGAVYSSIFQYGTSCTTRGSLDVSPVSNLDRLELYSNHIAQNNSHSRMETKWGEVLGGVGVRVG